MNKNKLFDAFQKLTKDIMLLQIKFNSNHISEMVYVSELMELSKELNNLLSCASETPLDFDPYPVAVAAEWSCPHRD